MTWRLPDTYHSAGTRQGTATLKFYEGRDILSDAVDRRSCLAATWGVVLVAITPGGRPIARRC